MATIQSIFWTTGVSGKAVDTFKLGKNIEDEYRSIQPIHPQFNMGTNPVIDRISLIKDSYDLISFMTDPSGKREEFKGFRLVIVNDEGESYFLQLGYRVMMFQALQLSADLRKAMGVTKLPKTSKGLNLKSLKHTTTAVAMFKDLEYNFNTFSVLEDLYMPLKSEVKDVDGKWGELHTPIKKKAKA